MKMKNKSKLKKSMKAVAIFCVVAMVTSMVLMFTGVLSQFIAMPIAIITPAIATIAAFIEKWDRKGMSRLKKFIYIARLLFIVGLATYGLYAWFALVQAS